MLDVKMRLVSMLGLLTIIVIAALVLDYFHIVRRPIRLGMGVAVLAMLGGLALTLNAVLPESTFFGPVFSEVKTTQKIVALTFDDGPNPPYTGQILDILKEKQVPATFFLTGFNAAKHPDLVRRIVAEGHQIGNHTYNHIDLLKVDRETVAAEIDRTNEVLRAAVGFAPQVVRPPHGFRDPAIMEVMASRNMTVVEWSVMSKDWTNPGVETIVRRTMGKVQNGSVILLHDGDGIASVSSRDQTVAATRQIIDELSAQGYKFVTVDKIVQATEAK